MYQAFAWGGNPQGSMPLPKAELRTATTRMLATEPTPRPRMARHRSR